MQAIEFETQIRDSIIELPSQFQLQTSQTVRVIILLDSPVHIMPNKSDRPLGLLKGQLNIYFADDFKMTEEEFLQS